MLCCIWNSSREHAVLICKSKECLRLLRRTLPLDFVWYFCPNCSVTKPKPRVTEPLFHHTYWSLLAVGLTSEVTACIKSCPALYNPSATLNMSHLDTLRCGWHLYSKDVMACLPKMFAKAQPRLRAPLGNRRRGQQCGPQGVLPKTAGREVLSKEGESEGGWSSYQYPEIRQDLR